MQPPHAVPGWEVLYVSDEDSFRTVQTTCPVDGRFYRVEESTRVALEGTGGWTVDASDPVAPRAVKGSSSKALNKAIRDGHIRVIHSTHHQSKAAS